LRLFVTFLTGALLLLWLPTDLQSISDGLANQPKLALGISLKIFMHTMAVIGLSLDKTFGYAFLLGATLQGLLVSSSLVRAFPLDDWWHYRAQLAGPVLDVLARLFCLGFLATRPGRLVGKEAKA